MSNEDKNHLIDAAEHASVDVESSVAKVGVEAHQPSTHVDEIIANHPKRDVVPAGPAGLSAPTDGSVSLTSAPESLIAPSPSVQKQEKFGVLDPRRYVEMVRTKNSRREIKNAA